MTMCQHHYNHSFDKIFQIRGNVFIPSITWMRFAISNIDHLQKQMKNQRNTNTQINNIFAKYFEQQNQQHKESNHTPTCPKSPSFEGLSAQQAFFNSSVDHTLTLGTIPHWIPFLSSRSKYRIYFSNNKE